METPPISARYGRNPWQVCVVPNLYPSLTPPPDNESLPPTVFDQEFEVKTSRESTESIPAHGFHEVIIESPTHVVRSSDLSVVQFAHMLTAYRDRMQFMYDRGARYVQVIKNSGRDAGASVRHTHSQVFGVPFVPEQVDRELRGASTYYERTKQCIFCQVLQQELEAKLRIVATSDEFVAWCPFASRVGYEMHVAPRSHAARFENSDDKLLEKLATFLRPLIHSLDQHPRIHAFNYLIHSLPRHDENVTSYHWHIEILPRIAKEAGFEWGTGVHINTVSPEQAAEELRV